MAMYVLGPLAEADVDEIWSYIAQDNSEMADLFIRELADTFWLLAENPMAGRPRVDLAPELRFFPYRRYCIFYYPTTAGVEISRVLHSARDLEPHFDQ